MSHLAEVPRITQRLPDMKPAKIIDFEAAKIHIDLSQTPHSRPHEEVNHEHHEHGPSCSHDHASPSDILSPFSGLLEGKKGVEVKTTSDVVREGTKIAIALSLPGLDYSDDQKKALISILRSQGDHPYPFYRSKADIEYNSKRDEVKKDSIIAHIEVLRKVDTFLFAQNLLEQPQVPFNAEAQDSFLQRLDSVNVQNLTQEAVIQELPDQFAYELVDHDMNIEISVTDSLRILALDFALLASNTGITPETAEKIKKTAILLRNSGITFSNFRSDDDIHVIKNNLKIPEGHSLECVQNKTKEGDKKELEEFQKKPGEDSNGLHGNVSLDDQGNVKENLAHNHLHDVAEQMQEVSKITKTVIESNTPIRMKVSKTIQDRKPLGYVSGNERKLSMQPIRANGGAAEKKDSGEEGQKKRISNQELKRTSQLTIAIKDDDNSGLDNNNDGSKDVNSAPEVSVPIKVHNLSQKPKTKERILADESEHTHSISTERTSKYTSQRSPLGMVQFGGEGGIKKTGSKSTLNLRGAGMNRSSSNLLSNEKTSALKQAGLHVVVEKDTSKHSPQPSISAPDATHGVGTGSIENSNNNTTSESQNDKDTTHTGRSQPEAVSFDHKTQLVHHAIGNSADAIVGVLNGTQEEAGKSRNSSIKYGPEALFRLQSASKPDKPKENTPQNPKGPKNMTPQDLSGENSQIAQSKSTKSVGVATGVTLSQAFEKREEAQNQIQAESQETVSANTIAQEQKTEIKEEQKEVTENIISADTSAGIGITQTESTAQVLSHNGTSATQSNESHTVSQVKKQQSSKTSGNTENARETEVVTKTGERARIIESGKTTGNSTPVESSKGRQKSKIQDKSNTESEISKPVQEATSQTDEKNEFSQVSAQPQSTSKTSISKQRVAMSTSTAGHTQATSLQAHVAPSDQLDFKNNRNVAQAFSSAFKTAFSQAA